MKCSACGSLVVDQVQFCTQCGAPLSVAQRAAAGAAGLGSPGVSAANAADRDPLIGQTLDGKYRLDALLGQGGMGRVYRASRPLIGDTVALKILSPEQIADNHAVERFRREAQAAARLKHPNAVNIYDFGVSEAGLVYLVMEMVEGQSLRALIKQQGPLTPVAAAEIFKQVCSALDEAHKQQIIHRDIKPDNIIVEANATGLRVKVLDFGIAKLRDLAPSATNLTQMGSIVGTPHYMSPEQCLGEELDHRSDIYSLGVVLYESLTGILPFNSPTSSAVVVQQVTQLPPPLRSINLSLSPAVEAVVLHALQKRREDRPQTAGNLAQELISAAQGLSYAASGPVTGITASGIPTPGSGGFAPTMQMNVSAIPSGSMTPLSTSFPSGAQASQWPAASGAPTSSKGKRIAIIIGIAAAAIIAVAAVVFLNLSSTNPVPQKPTQEKSTQAPLAITSEEIEQMIETWRQSWERGDMALYSTYYDANFSGRNYSPQKGYRLMTRNEWIADKEQKFRRGHSLTIQLGARTIEYSENEAIVSFTQSYRTAMYNDYGRKTLRLRKLPSGELKIIKEDFTP